MASADGSSWEARLQSALIARLGESRFQLWFGDAVTCAIEGDLLVVRAPNIFLRDRIQNQFAGILLEVAEEIAGHTLQLKILVDPGQADDASGALSALTTAAAEIAHRSSENAAAPIASRAVGSGVNGAFSGRSGLGFAGRAPRRLDDFVTGPGNRLAHAAAVEMVQTLGSTFNPLVIHGNLGMGKTHLLEGIQTAIRQRDPSLNLIAITAEAFTNGFLEAMRGNGLPGFRQRYRRAAMLLVDDVHFLAAKRATQDEFLHTFNALMQLGVPMVLTLDAHPRRISRLTEELATRFLGGMLVRIDPPDAATRRAILRAKSQARRVDVPEPVIAYLAEHVRSSVRELEGALHTVVAHALLTGRKIDLALARSALRDTIRHNAQNLALKDIERVVCDTFQLDPQSLRSDVRARHISHPRMLAMYLARKHTTAAYSEIGKFFGGRNHSTVIAAEHRVQNWLEQPSRSVPVEGYDSLVDLVSNMERALGT
jgi:chromosomal replication initiator protein